MDSGYSVPPVIVVQAPRVRRSYESYAALSVMIIGCVQIFIGITSLALGIANPLTCGLYGMIGDGIWGGVLYIITGVVGVVSSRRRTTCMINAHLVLCIISLISAAVELGLNATAAVVDNPNIRGWPNSRNGTDDTSIVYYPQWCYYYDTTNENHINYRGTTAVDALLASFAILELIMAGIASLLSCKVICCNEDFSHDMNSATVGPPQIHGLPAGAVMYYMAPNAKYQTSRA